MLELLREWGAVVGTLGTFATVGVMLWRASSFFTATRKEFVFINETIRDVKKDMKDFRKENKDDHDTLHKRINDVS